LIAFFVHGAFRRSSRSALEVALVDPDGPARFRPRRGRRSGVPEDKGQTDNAASSVVLVAKKERRILGIDLHVIRRKLGALNGRRRFGFIGIAALALGLVALGTGPALARRNASHAQLWSALGGKVTCGLAIRSPSSPNMALCGSRPIPPPHDPNDTEGDPGFVYLKQHGSPILAKLSQYSWERGWRYKESTTPTPLPAGTTWTLPGGGVKCLIRQTSVRCSNRDGKGFVLRRSSYRKIG
jgi:hypothetical protein